MALHWPLFILARRPMCHLHKYELDINTEGSRVFINLGALGSSDPRVYKYHRPHWSKFLADFDNSHSNFSNPHNICGNWNAPFPYSHGC